MYDVVSNDISEYISQRIEKICLFWQDRDVIIPVGKYKGRKGRVGYIGYEAYCGLVMQFRPYRLERRGMETITTTELLWDHPDARTFWPMRMFNELYSWTDEKEVA